MKKNKKLSLPKLIALIISGLLLASILGVFVNILILFDRIDFDYNPDPTFFREEEVLDPTDNFSQSLEPGQTPMPIETEAPKEQPVFNQKPPRDKNIINVLLIGIDRDNPNQNGRSDAMIIATLDKNKKELKLTSIMRDTYVYIPGDYRNNRINASFAFGNARLLMKTINANFNLEIDKYIALDFDMFKKVIDQIGNVNMELSKEESKIITGIYESGLYSLDSNQALRYTRLRSIDNDFGRTDRQRNLLTAIYNKGMNTSVLTLNSMLYDVLPLVTTNLTRGEIINIMTSVVSMGESEIQELRIPGEGTFRYANINNRAVLVPDINANTKIIHKFIYNKG